MKDCRKDRTPSGNKKAAEAQKAAKSRVPSGNAKKAEAEKQKEFMINYDRFKSKEEAIHQLLKDVKRFMVALPDDFTPKMLYEGYGEGVCYIVNDLTNRELIRRNFKFEMHRVLDEAPDEEDIRSDRED